MLNTFSSYPQKYLPVIGLEVHIQLNTNTKLFSSDPVKTEPLPNRTLSNYTLGHPGTLPCLNKEALKKALAFCMLTGCEIPDKVTFSRKNYFYPDLPKGFQITQSDSPVGQGGIVVVFVQNGRKIPVKIKQVQLEEDSGKSIHDYEKGYTLVDLNRAGTPLLEVVTEPCLAGADEAVEFLKEIRRMIRVLAISEGKMELGQLRCDANISLRQKDSGIINNKTEIKNLNSYHHLANGIEYELQRQKEILESGGEVVSQTLSYNPAKRLTIPMRKKESAEEYRYMHEPDLPAVSTASLKQEIGLNLPDSPSGLIEKYHNTFDLPIERLKTIVESNQMLLTFEALQKAGCRPVSALNWLTGPVKEWLNAHKSGMEAFPVRPDRLAGLIRMVDNKTISHSFAVQKALPDMIADPAVDPEIYRPGKSILIARSNDFIERSVSETFEKYPEKVREYKNGKKGIINLFVGEIMKRTQGQGDPEKIKSMVNELIKKYEQK